MTISWGEYVLGSLRGPDPYRECRLRCRDAFLQQRENIRRVFEATAPKVVACLGAGGLNDIPYDLFVKRAVTVHLVDWLPGSVDAGIEMSIIDTDQNGTPRCIYCDPAVECPQTYCCHYQKPSGSDAAVCARFHPRSGEPLRCAAFERADRPAVHYEDVTAGYASEFGGCILEELRGAHTWKQAFTRATGLAERIKACKSTLSIPEASVELVTSSMVLSQFEHEPYEYFSHRAADLLGPPQEKQQRRLMPRMERLRETLLVAQVERHCEEISRILAPGGVCYMSFELFHYLARAGQWFIVQGMPSALEVIGRWFNFNFDIVPEHETVVRFQSGDAPSLVCSFVLERKSL